MESTLFSPGRYAGPSWGIRHSFPGGTASFARGTLVLHGGYALYSPTVRCQEGGRRGHFHGGYAVFHARRGRRGQQTFTEGTLLSGLWAAWRARIFMGGTPFSGPTTAGALVRGMPFHYSCAANGDVEHAYVHGRYAISRGLAAAFFDRKTLVDGSRVLTNQPDSPRCRPGGQRCSPHTGH